jgi:hypothetical protein
MVRESPTPSPERVALLQWTARIGAVTAEALADRRGTTLASAHAQLLAAERARLLSRRRPLAEQPSLYTITRAGLQACGLLGLDPCRVSASNALHLITCAWVAGALARCYPDHRVLGERELRHDERAHGTQLASARLGTAPDGGPLLHRPDLVLWPDGPRPAHGRSSMPCASVLGLPVAVEVELTVKAPRRLADICRAWARCRCVAGALYLVAPEVERAVRRAIDAARAHERVVAVPLATLPRFGEAAAARRAEPSSSAAIQSAVPSDP